MREFAGLEKLKTVVNLFANPNICETYPSFHVSLETRLISLIIYFYILITMQRNAMHGKNYVF